MNRYDLAVFDADGTLLDTTEGILSAIRYTIEKLKLPQLTDNQIISFIGPPIQMSFEKVYGLTGKELDFAAETFRNRYKDEDLLKAKPYPGIFELFDELNQRGVKLAVATYKRQDYATTILEHFGFHRYTNILYGSDFTYRQKKVDIIKKCLNDALITDTRKAVMIGDTAHDALGAQQIGIDFIGVTYGFEFKAKNDVEQYPCVGCADKAINILTYF